jgi:hypothetical protein
MMAIFRRATIPTTDPLCSSTNLITYVAAGSYCCRCLCFVLNLNTFLIILLKYLNVKTVAEIIKIILKLSRCIIALNCSCVSVVFEFWGRPVSTYWM